MDTLQLPSAVAPALPLFKASPLSLPEAAPATNEAAAVPAAPAVRSASCSHSHSHTESLAALLADEASTPRPHATAAQQSSEQQVEEPTQPQEQLQQEQLHAGGAEAADAFAGPHASEDALMDDDADVDGRAWQHALVTCPWLFKPCPSCCRTHTGREVLMTYFDPSQPAARGMCGFCPDRVARAAAAPGGLLQIRRSTYHEVVKAADLGRLADVSGIQHYVINGECMLGCLADR